MKYYITNQKLDLLLNELGEEYKDLLIEKMLTDYQTGDIDNLPISEILKLDVSIKEHLVQDKQIEKKKRMYTMFSSIGLMYSLLGIFLLFFQEFKYSFSQEPMNMLALILIIIGLFISFYAMLVKNLIIKRKPYVSTRNNTNKSYEYISLWKELEGLMIQVAPDNIPSSPSKLIQYLLDSNFISIKDENAIRNLLKLRNEAVHSTSSPKQEISQEEHSTLVKNIRAIISKLNNLA